MLFSAVPAPSQARRAHTATGGTRTTTTSRATSLVASMDVAPCVDHGGRGRSRRAPPTAEGPPSLTVLAALRGLGSPTCARGLRTPDAGARGRGGRVTAVPVARGVCRAKGPLYRPVCDVGHPPPPRGAVPCPARGGGLCAAWVAAATRVTQDVHGRRAASDRAPTHASTTASNGDGTAAPSAASETGASASTPAATCPVATTGRKHTPPTHATATPAPSAQKSDGTLTRRSSAPTRRTPTTSATYATVVYAAAPGAGTGTNGQNRAKEEWVQLLLKVLE